jgi:hypothetical protein
MMIFLLRRLRLVLNVIVSLAVCVSVAGADPRHSLQVRVAAQKPTVVIVEGPMTAVERESEAYADWAGYLNDFYQQHRGDIGFLKIKPAKIKAIFAESTPIKSRFAVIFFRNYNDAIFYDGMIHDQIIYPSAAAYLQGKRSLDSVAALGLTPYRFRFR